MIFGGIVAYSNWNETFYKTKLKIKGENKMNFISGMLQDLLNILFSFTGDLGVAIVVITLMVKLILMPEMK